RRAEHAVLVPRRLLPALRLGPGGDAHHAVGAAGAAAGIRGGAPRAPAAHAGPAARAEPVRPVRTRTRALCAGAARGVVGAPALGLRRRVDRVRAAPRSDRG